jgi:hypothetical protein
VTARPLPLGSLAHVAMWPPLDANAALTFLAAIKVRDLFNFVSLTFHAALDYFVHADISIESSQFPVLWLHCFRIVNLEVCFQLLASVRHKVGART